ncbi:MAG: thioredoxin domain-containing protein [Saprospiraceae bacterium]
MYKFASFVIIIPLVFNIVSGQGIQFFEGTWKEAMEKAKKEEKLMFIDCYAKWCGPCKAMAKNTFTVKEVGDFYNENFINLKLDMEEVDGVSFGHKYAVSAYPTLYFLDGEGKVVKKMMGGQRPDGLIQLGKEAIKSNDQSSKYEEKYHSGDRSYDLILGYVKALNSAGKPSAKIANDYIRSKPDITEDQLLVFYYEALVEADSRIFQLVVDHRTKLDKLVGYQMLHQKLTNSLKNSAQKAINFESEALLNETVASARIAIPTQYESFSHESKMAFYSAMRKPEKYIESYRSYIKSDSKNAATYRKVIESILQSYADQPEMMKDAVRYAEKMFDLAGDIESLKILVKTFALHQSYDDGIKIVEKAKEKAIKKGDDGSQYESLIGYLKSKK